MWTARIVGVATALGAFGCGDADGKGDLFEDARAVAQRRMRTCSEDMQLYWDWRQLEQ